MVCENAELSHPVNCHCRVTTPNGPAPFPDESCPNWQALLLQQWHTLAPLVACSANQVAASVASPTGIGGGGPPVVAISRSCASLFAAQVHLQCPCALTRLQAACPFRRAPPVSLEQKFVIPYKRKPNLNGRMSGQGGLGAP